VPVRLIILISIPGNTHGENFLLVIFTYSLVVPAHALPIEPLTTVISKIVKMFASYADDAARTVSKSVDAVPPKAPMDAPAAESGNVTQAAETFYPKYKLTEPIAQSALIEKPTNDSETPPSKATPMPC
jgi:hypothetical protein